MRFEKAIAASIRLVEMFPKRYKVRNASAQRKDPPFFIFGSGRNGSTLLGTILNRHPEVFMTPEQYALPFASIRYRLLNILGWRYLVKMTLREFSRPENYRTPIDFSYLSDKLIKLPKQERDLLSIMDLINQELASIVNRNPRIWGDKTPENTRKYHFLKPLIQGSKVVFMIRDGRDVVSSFAKAKKEDFGINADPMVAAHNWSHSVAVWTDIVRTIPEKDRLMVRYEDLVSDPETTVEKVCKHLGVAFTTSMLMETSEDTMDVGGLKDHINATRQVSPSSVGAWKERMDPATYERILPIIAADLRKMDYEVD